MPCTLTFRLSISPGNSIRNELKGWLGTEYGTALYPNISDNHDIVLASAVNLAIASLRNESEPLENGKGIVFCTTAKSHRYVLLPSLFHNF
jgi:hypothetical protein